MTFFGRDNGIEIVASRDRIWGDRIHLRGRWIRGNTVSFWREAVWEQITPETDGIDKPAPLAIDPTAAQVLMDSLWDCGLRPSEGSGSAGALAATQRHLEDLRHLVFKAQPKDLPNK